MIFKSGNHAGRPAEYVLLRYADDAAFIMQTYPESPTAKEYVRLAKRFDAKPYAVKCTGCPCLATRASAYRGAVDLYFWCDDCDPYDRGALPGRLVEIRTIAGAIKNAGNQKMDRRDVVKALAAAKGCPRRLRNSDAVDFLK